MLIEIKRDDKVALNCRETIEVKIGEHDYPDHVAQILIDCGAAKQIEKKSEKVEVKEKKALPKLQNKAITKTKNKGKK